MYVYKLQKLYLVSYKNIHKTLAKKLLYDKSSLSLRSGAVAGFFHEDIAGLL